MSPDKPIIYNEANTIRSIRRVLADERREQKNRLRRLPQPEAALPEPDPSMRPVQLVSASLRSRLHDETMQPSRLPPAPTFVPSARASRSRALTEPRVVASAQPEDRADAPRQRGLPRRLAGLLVPTALLTAMAMFWPAVLVSLAVGSVLLPAALMMALGAGRFWRAVAWIAGFNLRGTPAGAARAAARLERIADLWHGILDRFPDRMVEGLRIPDFTQSVLDEEPGRHRFTGDAARSA